MWNCINSVHSAGLSLVGYHVGIQIVRMLVYLQQRSLTLKLNFENHQDDHSCGSFTDSKKEGSQGGGGVPDALLHWHHLSGAGWYPCSVIGSVKSLTSNRFVLNMVKGPHFQCHSPLFQNFKWFYIKAAYHPVIQEDLLLRCLLSTCMASYSRR